MGGTPVLTTSAIFGEIVFGYAIFGDDGTPGGACSTTVSTDLAGLVTGIEAIPDTRFKAVLPFRERGTRYQKLVIVKASSGTQEEQYPI